MEWSVITPPVDLDGKHPIPVELTIDLAAGIPLRRLESLYHAIETEEIETGHYSIRLSGDLRADRDFVLEWQPENLSETKAALFAETLEDNQYMLLMLMPPQQSGSPGEGAHCILAGHRDTSFAFLKELLPGDELILEGNNGKEVFIVQATGTVRAEDLYLDSERGGTLTLITCFPFQAIMPNTPVRYVVTAMKW